MITTIKQHLMNSIKGQPCPERQDKKTIHGMFKTQLLSLLVLFCVLLNSFLVACTRLYKPLCRSVGRSVGWSVPLYFFGAVAYRDACARLMAIGLVCLEGFPLFFLVATTYLYKRSCPFVRRSVHSSVDPSVGPSVGPSVPCYF